MDEDRDSLLAVVRTLIDHFERSGIDYAFGGAIAYSAWAEPRATRDVDLNVWVELGKLPRVFDVLEAAGVTVERDGARDEARRRGMFVCRHGPYRVDVFVPSVPFYATALERRVRTRIESRPTWVLSAERPRRWTYRTAALSGEMWGLAFRFAARPTELAEFTRDGVRLIATGTGTITITGARGCRFTETLPFRRRLPAGC